MMALRQVGPKKRKKYGADTGADRFLFSGLCGKIDFQYLRRGGFLTKYTFYLVSGAVAKW